MIRTQTRLTLFALAVAAWLLALCWALGSLAAGTVAAATYLVLAALVITLPRAEDPVPQPTDNYSYCESSWATPLSKFHIRALDGDHKRTGGGIEGTALCGRDLAKGWDISERNDVEATPAPKMAGLVCPGCFDEMSARRSRTVKR